MEETTGTPTAKKLRFIKILAILLVAYLAFALLRPMPSLIGAEQINPTTTKTKHSLAWPKYGQAALASTDMGMLAKNGAQKSMPAASVVKIVTALVVLNKKPLSLGEKGPTLTLGPADVAIYNKYFRLDGSVVLVKSGEKITEYEALEAMLLPSANNMAESLAIWAFGSTQAYLAEANSYVKSLGLADTHLADASGFSAKSVSSAHDLVKLGLQAMANPVIAQIAAKAQATIPVAGKIHSTNWLLGTDNIVGIKTGNTTQAGGCFLFAANVAKGPYKTTIVGAIMGAPDIRTALLDSHKLAKSADAGFIEYKPVKTGQIVGYYKAPWSNKVNIVATKDLSALAWSDNLPQARTYLNKLGAPASSGDQIGTINLASQSQPLAISGNIYKPSLAWRLTHPF